jgi:hypothetical protein
MTTSCHCLFHWNTTTRRQWHIAFVFFFSNIKKTKHTKKLQQKKQGEGRELTFKLPLCPLTFGSHFCPLTFALSFQVFFPNIFFFSSKKKKKKHRTENKCKERKELTFKLLLYLLTFDSRFYPPTFAFLFQTFSLGIFFFSSRRKKKHTHTHKEKKNHRKKKNAKKGGRLPLSSHFALSFLALASILLLLPFRFKHFLLASSSSQTKEKKKKNK